MTTIPTCVRLTPAGVTLQDTVTSFHAWLTANPGNFTISNVVGSPVTSFTITHTDGWQQNFRVSGGALLSMIAPTGGIESSAAPGTPTGHSVEDVLLPAFTGTIADVSVARYADALFLSVKATGATHSAFTFHSGRIGLPEDASDAARGIDGLGILAYVIDQSANTAFSWFTINVTASNRKSKIRAALTTVNGWVDPTVRNDVVTQPSTTFANRRFCSVKLVAGPPGGVPAQASNADLMALKYIRSDATTSLLPFQVVPSASTNQAWMAIGGANTNTRLRCLWNKTVTP